MPPPLFSHLFIVEFSCVCVLEKSLSAKLSHSRLCLLLNGRRHFRAARKTLHICFWFSFSGGPAFFFIRRVRKKRKEKKCSLLVWPDGWKRDPPHRGISASSYWSARLALLSLSLSLFFPFAFLLVLFSSHIIQLPGVRSNSAHASTHTAKNGRKQRERESCRFYKLLETKHTHTHTRWMCIIHTQDVKTILPATSIRRLFPPHS